LYIYYQENIFLLKKPVKYLKERKLDKLD